MRRHRNWQELAEGDRKVVEGKRRRQKPVGLLSDPMGVSLFAGFGFGYDVSYSYKSGSGVTA